MIRELGIAAHCCKGGTDAHTKDSLPPPFAVALLFVLRACLFVTPCHAFVAKGLPHVCFSALAAFSLVICSRHHSMSARKHEIQNSHSIQVHRKGQGFFVRSTRSNHYQANPPRIHNGITHCIVDALFLLETVRKENEGTCVLSLISCSLTPLRCNVRTSCFHLSPPPLVFACGGERGGFTCDVIVRFFMIPFFTLRSRR
jgi:hypothetical protein